MVVVSYLLMVPCISGMIWPRSDYRLNHEQSWQVRFNSVSWFASGISSVNHFGVWTITTSLQTQTSSDKTREVKRNSPYPESVVLDSTKTQIASLSQSQHIHSTLPFDHISWFSSAQLSWKFSWISKFHFFLVVFLKLFQLHPMVIIRATVNPNVFSRVLLV